MISIKLDHSRSCLQAGFTVGALTFRGVQTLELKLNSGGLQDLRISRTWLMGAENEHVTRNLLMFLCVGPHASFDLLTLNCIALFHCVSLTDAVNSGLRLLGAELGHRCLLG